MRVPPVIESGSVDHVILDCNYDVTYMEGKQLDIKWFFGDDHQPFYQWLPGHRPQTMGSVFKDRIDLSYVADNGRAGEYERHRAIKILRPTTEMSGLYKCKVSSFVDEDFLTARMTVFAPASDVSLIYTKPDAQTVNLTCSVEGVYPEPEVELSWGPRSSERGVTTTLTMERRGLFDVSVYKILEEDALRRETVFGCEVSIPGTSYRIREETMYFPGKVLYQITSANSSPAPVGLSVAWPALLLAAAVASLRDYSLRV